MILSDVCLSVTSIGRKSRTERLRKTKIGTEVANVTCDSDTTFKVKVTRPLCSPPCWRIRRLQRWAWERFGRGKLLLRCRRFGAHVGGEGRSISWRPPTYSLFQCYGGLLSMIVRSFFSCHYDTRCLRHCVDTSDKWYVHLVCVYFCVQCFISAY